MIKSKKQMFIVIGTFVLVLLLGTTTYAFFNYTRTGTANTIKTGRIYFNAEQDGRVTLDGLFPITTDGNVTASTPGVGSLSLHVTGDTTYTEGIEYRIKAVNVTGANGTELPISISISYEPNGQGKTIGVIDEDYFTNRGGNSSIYKLLTTDTITNDGDLVVGYIAPGETGIDGNIVIMAYLDARNIAISDTYDEDEPETDNNGTTTNWVNGRTVFTTEEWNQLTASGISFQIKAEANEGTWVIPPATVRVLNDATLMQLGGAKRYVGGSDETNNYVYFNNNERWRIIGVYGDNLKIVKAEDPLLLKYNNSSSSAKAWEGSLMESTLNGTYYNGLTDDAKSKIEEGTWYVGECYYSDTAEEAYISTQSVVWRGKVGMVATYEYLYTTNNTSCYEIGGQRYDEDDCGKISSNWLRPDLRMWTMTYGLYVQSYGINAYGGFIVSHLVTDEERVYPAVYLKSSVKIVDGTGSYNDPYVLE